MIVTYIKFGSDFDNIREKILIEATVPTFDDVFNQFLCHSSIASTRSLKFEPTSNSSVCYFLSNRPLHMILMVGARVVMVKVSILNVTELNILMIIAIDCMVILYALLMWLRPMLPPCRALFL